MNSFDSNESPYEGDGFPPNTGMQLDPSHIEEKNALGQPENGTKVVGGDGMELHGNNEGFQRMNAHGTNEEFNLGENSMNANGSNESLTIKVDETKPDDTKENGDDNDGENTLKGSGSPDDTSTLPPDGLTASSLNGEADTLERTLRTFVIIGFIPFLWIGWVIGAIYGACSKKTKRTHHKLTKRLFVMSILGFMLIAAVIGIIFVSRSRKESKSADNIERNGVPLDGVETLKLASKDSNKTMVFVMNGLHSSWDKSNIFTELNKEGYNVYVANVKNEKSISAKQPIGKTDILYGLSKFKVILEYLDVKLTNPVDLVAVFNRDDALLFDPNKLKKSYATITAISDEVIDDPDALVEKTPKSPLIVPKVATHVIFINKEIKCPESRNPPPEVTFNGTKDYSTNVSLFKDLSKVFYTNNPEKSPTKNIDRSSADETTKFLKIVETAVQSLKEYNKLVEDSSSQAVLCKKL